jgi:hypothetical protein
LAPKFHNPYNFQRSSLLSRIVILFFNVLLIVA